MKKISILLLVIVAVLASCKKVPEVNTEYVDVERDLITVGTTKATIQCDYEYIATLKKAYFHYGEGSDTTKMTSAEMRVVQKTLYVELSDLKENTTYSYYYEFANGFNSMKSVTRTFKTEGPGTTITMPTVVTAEVTEITSNSAKSGGEITNDGGAEVTERGVCWSTNANPTLNDHHIASGTGTGAFTAMMSSLEANTIYHVRAYAINETGTAYGLDREFTTLSGGSVVPEGAINGLFTINENGDQVYFSQGNLQYQASTNTWRFAENQWNFVGGVDGLFGTTHGNVYENGVKCDNNLISSTYNGWIDLFGWGTSGWNNGNIYFEPFDSFCESTAESGASYGPIGRFDLVGEYANSDWGVYNSIVNGGNIPNQWRTLNKDEWDYLYNERETTFGVHFANAKVNGVSGTILLPDDWDINIFELYGYDALHGTSYDNNIVSDFDWIVLESNGAVFLPSAGSRGPLVGNLFHPHGYYWTSTHGLFDYNGGPEVNAQFAGFPCAGGEVAVQQTLRNAGMSVRLVQDANK